MVVMGTLPGLSGQDPYDPARKRMVRDQLAGRDIRDPEVLKAMEAVPRHLFVPENYRASAYADTPLPIGHDQTISQPYMVAAMTEALQLNPGDRVLEIGTGSGYQAAVLAQMGMEVYTIEIVEPLGLETTELLKSLGYDRVSVRIGDGYHGWPEAAPFQGIIVTAGAPSIPKALQEQLADGGRLLIPIGTQRGVQELVRVTRRGDRFVQEELMSVRFVPFTRLPEE